MSEKLLNCPFCNGKASIEDIHVFCSECGCMPVNLEDDNLENNIKLWNNRPTPKSQEGLVAIPKVYLQLDNGDWNIECVNAVDLLEMLSFEINKGGAKKILITTDKQDEYFLYGKPKQENEGLVALDADKIISEVGKMCSRNKWFHDSKDREKIYALCYMICETYGQPTQDVEPKCKKIGWEGVFIKRPDGGVIDTSEHIASKCVDLDITKLEEDVYEYIKLNLLNNEGDLLNISEEIVAICLSRLKTSQDVEMVDYGFICDKAQEFFYSETEDHSAAFDRASFQQCLEHYKHIWIKTSEVGE